GAADAGGPRPQAPPDGRVRGAAAAARPPPHAPAPGGDPLLVAGGGRSGALLRAGRQQLPAQARRLRRVRLCGRGARLLLAGAQPAAARPDGELAMPTSLRVLLVEDSALDAELVLRELRRAGFEVHHQRVASAEELRTALRAERWQLVLSDHALPG